MSKSLTHHLHIEAPRYCAAPAHSREHQAVIELADTIFSSSAAATAAPAKIYDHHCAHLAAAIIANFFHNRFFITSSSQQFEIWTVNITCAQKSPFIG